MAYQQERALAKNRIRRRGIYLLPNLFTTAALFAGFYAIVQAMNGRFQDAAVAIFVAMVLDGLDGRVARLTKTQSAFGAEYDSLADMVSFGAAPALVVYEWALRSLGKPGWIAAFVYVAGAALRLARFNTMLEVADKRYFQGLPSPAAAALVAGFVWVIDDYGVDPETVRWVGWAVTIFAGLTMVSNFKYYSFKTINLRRSVPVRRGHRFGDVLRAGQLATVGGAVRRLRRIRRLRVCVVGVAGDEAAALGKLTRARPSRWRGDFRRHRSRSAPRAGASRCRRDRAARSRRSVAMPPCAPACAVRDGAASSC